MRDRPVVCVYRSENDRIVGRCPELELQTEPKFWRGDAEDSLENAVLKYLGERREYVCFHHRRTEAAE